MLCNFAKMIEEITFLYKKPNLINNAKNSGYSTIEVDVRLTREKQQNLAGSLAKYSQ